MEFTVYILFSEMCKRTYVGQTQDVASRLKLHNAGRVFSTRGCLPWRLIYQEQCCSRGEATKREQWLKTRSGRRFMKHLFDHSESWQNG